MFTKYYDVNKVDPELEAKIKKGCWQDVIPVSGEVAKPAKFPQKDFVFTEIAKDKLDDAWKIGE